MKKPKDILLAEKISKLYEKRNKLFKSIDKQIDKKKMELDKICTHSETQTKEENREGGYDYVSQYHKITECKICGKEIDRKITYGSYA